MPPYGGDDVLPSPLGHVDVHQHDVGPVGEGQGDGVVLTQGGADDAQVVLVLEEVHERAQYMRVVVDDENPQ